MLCLAFLRACSGRWVCVGSVHHGNGTTNHDQNFNFICSCPALLHKVSEVVYNIKVNKIRFPLKDSIVPLGEQESKQIATINNSRNKQVSMEGLVRYPGQIQRGAR